MASDKWVEAFFLGKLLEMMDGPSGSALNLEGAARIAVEPVPELKRALDSDGGLEGAVNYDGYADR